MPHFPLGVINCFSCNHFDLSLYHFSDDASTEPALTSRGKPRLKKRKQKPEKWKKNVNKIKRNSGEAYISHGVLRPAKCVQEPCAENCKLKCRTLMTEEQRLAVFKHYWSLADLNLQRQFVAGSLEKVLPKYRYAREGSNRSINYAYNLWLNNDKRVRVCKMFFLNTLNISSRVVRTTLEKLTGAGYLEDDKRGKHGNHRRAESIV